MLELDHPLPPTATLVRDSLAAALSDGELQSDLSMEDVMPWWLASGLADALSELGVATRQFQVRTCTHPLAEYNQNPKPFAARYHCQTFLEADGYFFTVGYEGKDCSASGMGLIVMGLVVLESVEAAVSHQLAQRDKEIHWYTDHSWMERSDYIHPNTRNRMMAYASKPFVHFQQACLEDKTPGAATTSRSPRL